MFLFQKRLVFLLVLCLHLNQAKPVQKGIIDFTAPSCCDPIMKKVTFHEKFQEIPQLLLTIRAIEYDVGPVGFFAQIQDVTETDFHFQLTVTHSILKQLTYEYVAINQEEVEFGFFNIDALATIKEEETGDRVIPTFMKFKRTFNEDPVVQVFLIGLESKSKLVQFEVSPLTVSHQGVTLNLKKFGETSVQKVQLAYVATQSSKELAMSVTHTGAKQAHVEREEEENEDKELEKKADKKEEKKDEKKDEKKEESKEEHKEEKKEIEEEKKGEFIQLKNGKPKLVQINGLNGLRFMQTPIGFMWQGDQIEPTALNVNLRITLDKGNQAVLGLYYFEEKPYKKCPRVYTMCNYKGTYVSLCKDIPNFNQIIKSAKSIYIPEKTSVVVYQDTSYGGNKSKISKSIDCISDWFAQVPETEQKNIKQFLQINSLKKHKDAQLSEIREEEQQNIKQKQYQYVSTPNWQEQYATKIEDDFMDGFSGTFIEKDSSHPLNSVKQELIQKFQSEEDNYFRSRY